jgi:hypothetical protein
MAGTNDDNTTCSVPAADLLLLGGSLSLIVQHTHCSERAAKKLIEDYLSGRGLSAAPRLRRRYASAEGHRGQFEPNGQRDAFYMADPQRRIFVDYDYEASTVRRRAPRRLSPSWPTQLMGPEPDTDCTLHFFQLHRGDLEEILQVMGLMPRPTLAEPPSPPRPPHEPTLIAPPVEAAFAVPPPPSEEPQRPQPEESRLEEHESPLRLPEAPQSLPEEPKKQWQPKEAKIWLAMMMSNHPPGGNKNEWARWAYEKMKADFEVRIPWVSWEVLRRRMNDKET